MQWVNATAPVFPVSAMHFRTVDSGIPISLQHFAKEGYVFPL